jgi:zinc protease
LQTNLDKWRAEDKTSFEPQLKTNGFWLSYINGQLQNQEDLDQVNRQEALMDKVTPDQLKEIAKKYLNGDNYIRLVLLPETVSTSK